MSEALCQVETCDRPVRDATVCGACTGQLEKTLGDIPALAEELDTTLARQTAIGDRNGKARSAVKPLPYDPRASEAGWVLRNTLVGWVRELAPGDLGDYELGDCEDTLTGMARWLLARAGELRVHPAGGEAVDEILAAVRDAERTTDRQWRRFTIGTCVMPNCGGSLTAALTVDPDGQSWIVCDTDEDHVWPETYWLFLGNWIHSARMVA